MKWAITSRRWVGVVALGIVLAGCAGTRTVDQQSATTLLESSDYAGYARLYLDAEGKPKYDNTSLLDSLEAGKAFNDAGLWEYSREAFDAAGQLLSWKEDTIDTPEEVVNFVGTTLTSDAFGAYQGKIHQGLLVDYYQAINHLMMGSEANARVDFNRLQVRQRNAQTQLSAYAKTINSSVRSSLKDEDSGTATRSLGEVGPKIADGIKDLPSGLSQSKIRLASGDVLSAVFRATSASTQDKRANLTRDMLKSARQATATKGGGAMVAYLDRELRKSKNELKDKVVVVYEDGVGPSLKEFRVDLPLFLVTDKVTYTGIALPQFVPGRPAFGSLKVGAGKAAGETATLSDLNALAAMEFDVAYKGVVAKAVLSTVIKTAAQAAINHQVDENASPLIAALVKVGTGLGQAALTRADTRAWANLPNSIQMAVVDRPKNGELELIAPSGQVLGTVSIPEKTNTLVLVKASGLGGQPAIYQQSLPAEKPVMPPTVLAAYSQK